MTRKAYNPGVLLVEGRQDALLMFRFIISSKSATYIIISRTPKRFYLKLQTFSAQLFDFDRATVLVNS